MKFRPRHTRFESGPNMTPLVDVVMVILIFLMLVGTFTSGEWFLQQSASVFSTASSRSNQPPPADFVPDEPIVVRVNYRTPDTYTAQVEGLSTSDPAALAAKLKDMREKLEAIGKPLDKMTVVIQPQPSVRHAQYIQVYEAALEAGFKKVSFAVTQ